MPPGVPGGNENGDSSLQQYDIVAKMMATAYLSTRRREANHSIRMALRNAANAVSPITHHGYLGAIPNCLSLKKYSLNKPLIPEALNKVILHNN